MKKIWMLLLSIFVMYGCGSGGGGSTSSTPTGSSGSSSVSGQPGNFTLTLSDGVAASSTSRHALAIINPLPAGTMARVVIRKVETVSVPEYEIDDEGNSTGVIIGYHNVDTETYRRVADEEIIDNKVSVTAPVSAGPTDFYTFDVLTYIPGTQNTMLKFGHNPSVAVTNGGNAGVIMNDICADPGVSVDDPAKVGSVSMQIPLSIISEQAYNVTADAKTPVRRGYYELGIALPSGAIQANRTYDLSTSPLIIYGSTRLTAPYTIAPSDTTLLFKVKYFISDDMLDPTKNESYKNWVRIYPNNVGTTGEALASTLTPLTSITVPAN